MTDFFADFIGRQNRPALSFVLYTPKYADQLTKKQRMTSKITYLPVE